MTVQTNTTFYDLPDTKVRSQRFDGGEVGIFLNQGLGQIGFTGSSDRALADLQDLHARIGAAIRDAIEAQRPGRRVLASVVVGDVLIEAVAPGSAK